MAVTLVPMAFVIMVMPLTALSDSMAVAPGRAVVVMTPVHRAFAQIPLAADREAGNQLASLLASAHGTTARV